MADLEWPADLAPYRVSFYLQPHVGGQESPFSRTRKVYGLSAPRWIARFTFRGGYDGRPLFGEQSAFGPRLDSLIADMEGGLFTVGLWDWRRPAPIVPSLYRARGVPLTIAVDAPAGASSVSVAGYSPGAVAMSLGDYIGGDGRPHLVSAAMTRAAGGAIVNAGLIFADATGSAVIGFRPPLSVPLAAGTVLTWPVIGDFQLASEDAGQNEVEVGEAVEYTLDFTEKLP